MQAPTAEVRRVVQRVIRHARLHPERSLAVVTPSARHAARVAQGVSAVLGQRPELAEFFRPGPESFRVVDLHRAVGLQRDTVIFSVGFGRTDHDRVLPYLGQLSDRDGRRGFVLGMTRSRLNTIVVSSIRPEELEPSSLHNGARDLHRLLLRIEEAGHIRIGAADEPLLAQKDERQEDLQDAAGTSEAGDAGAEAPEAEAAHEPPEPVEAAERPEAQDRPKRPHLSLVGAQEPARAEQDDEPAAEPATQPILVHDPMELADAAVHEDALVQDLSRRLVQRGAAVRHHHEDAIDLIAWSETAESLSAGAVVGQRSSGDPVRIPVAVVSDGTEQVARMSVRERSRLRPQQLERSGWNHLTLWTIEVFTQPDAVAGLICRYLGLPADTGTTGVDGAGTTGRS